MNQVTDTTNCFQRKITRRIKSQAQQQTAFLWKQFVVVPVTWFILLSFSGSSLLCLWLHSSCYLSLEAVCCCACDLIHLVISEKDNKKNQVTGTTTNCFQRKITRWIMSQAQQQTASRERSVCCACDLIHLVIFLWKQFVVVPVTWFILLSFSGSSLLLCLWLDSSCYLSMELSCWSSCLHLLLSNLSRETLCRLCPGLSIWQTQQQTASRKR
jgi:hypothetical protein